MLRRMATDPRPGERLDLTSEPASGSSTQPSAPAPRPFVGVQFECCEAYARIYINRDRTAYEGRCPRCLRQLTVKIGPGGTSSRFFRAG
jgi:hypothetical protein